VTSLCIHASVNAKRANQFSVCVCAILHPLCDLNMASPLSEATGLSRKGGTSCKTNRAQLSLSPCISCSLQNGLSYFSPGSDHRNLKPTGVRLNVIHMVHDVALRSLLKSDISHLTWTILGMNFLCNNDVCKIVWGIQSLSCYSRFFLKEHGTIGGEHVLFWGGRGVK